MNTRALSLIAMAAALLSGCAYPADWTPEMITAYEQGQAARQAQTNQWSQQMNNQAIGVLQSTAPQPVQIGPYNQPNSTSTYYCRDLTGSMVSCKQLR